MKALLTLILVLMLAGVVQAGDPMKIDEHDGIADLPSRIQVAGVLEDADPTWHRWRGSDYGQFSLDCMLDMTYEYSSEPHYDVYCITSSDTEPVQIWTAQTDGQFDTVLYLYCDPFDPMNSTENCITVDDDNGDGLLSFIGLITTITLTPGENYYLVVCGYSSSSLGNYLIESSENVDFCPVAVEETDWSTLKNLYR